MGAALTEQVVESVDGDFGAAVITFIPNTAETAWYGLMDGLRHYRRDRVRANILEAARSGDLDEDLLNHLIMGNWPRGEKIAHKDIKMRTFISQEKGRAQLVSHVYDITYGVVGEDDVLVALDDSIVRGTTLKTSILKMRSLERRHACSPDTSCLRKGSCLDRSSQERDCLSYGRCRIGGSQRHRA